MLHTLSALAAVTASGAGTAAAAEASHILQPKAPSVTTPKVASAVKRIAGLEVKAPTVDAPKAPKLDLRPLDCTNSTCSPDDPTDLAGTVVSFNRRQLTERISSGHTYTAAVDDKTNIACPTQQAIDDGHVFNPVTPSISKVGSGQMSTPDKPKMTDKYACSATNITAGQHIALAELGRDNNGQLHWIAVALVPLH